MFLAQPGDLSAARPGILSQDRCRPIHINLKVPTGTRIEVTDQYIAKVEDLIRHDVEPKDLKLIVSNIGVVPDFSALYTTNAGPYTATVQVR